MIFAPRIRISALVQAKTADSIRGAGVGHETSKDS
jgi:hypothetical protein